MRQGEVKGYTVKQVAEMAGVSVRTLHHYDHIGLLKPRAATTAGYRLYRGPELELLQQILFYREIGLSLAQIKGMVCRPGFDRISALQSHRDALVARRKRIDVLITTIDRTLATAHTQSNTERNLEDAQLFDGFDVDKVMAQHATHDDEVDAKAAGGEWDPKLVADSRRRVNSYSKAQMGQILKRGQDLTTAMAQVMDTGADPADPRMQKLVGDYRQHISESFYECSTEVFAGLGKMYAQDHRFRATYEKVRPGLAQFLSTAIARYCATAH